MQKNDSSRFTNNKNKINDIKNQPDYFLYLHEYFIENNYYKYWKEIIMLINTLFWFENSLFVSSESETT